MCVCDSDNLVRALQHCLANLAETPKGRDSCSSPFVPHVIIFLQSAMHGNVPRLVSPSLLNPAARSTTYWKEQFIKYFLSLQSKPDCV